MMSLLLRPTKRAPPESRRASSIARRLSSVEGRGSPTTCGTKDGTSKVRITTSSLQRATVVLLRTWAIKCQTCKHRMHAVYSTTCEVHSIRYRVRLRSSATCGVPCDFLSFPWPSHLAEAIYPPSHSLVNAPSRIQMSIHLIINSGKSSLAWHNQNSSRGSVHLINPLVTRQANCTSKSAQVAARRNTSSLDVKRSAF